MDKFKELLRTNKKIVAIILVTLLGFAGVKVAPETADKLVSAVVEIVAPEQPAEEPTP